MKKRMTKLSTLLLSMIMCLCCIVPALAATTQMQYVGLKSEDTKEAVIHAHLDTTNEASLAGMKAIAFRIIKVSVTEIGTEPNISLQPAEPEYTWAPGVSKWVENNYRAYINTSDNSVTDAYLKLQERTGDGNEGNEELHRQFIDALAAAIKKGDQDIAFTKNADGTFDDTDKSTDPATPLVKSANVNETDGIASIEGVSKGSYIVLIEGGSRIYKPAVANLIPVWLEEDNEYGKAEGWYVNSPVDIQIKDAEVSITKTITDKPNPAASDYSSKVSSAMGDTIYSKIEAVIPEYLPKAINKTFIISDTLPAGLTGRGDLKITAVKTENGTETEITIPAANYTTTETDGVWKVEFDQAKYDELLAGYEKVRITYASTLNTKANVGHAGNETSATMTYANNPYLDNAANAVKTTAPVKASVYTYGLDLTKENATGTELAGAVFTLEKKAADGQWYKVNVAEKTEGTAGEYYRTVNGKTDIVSGEGDSLGKMIIRGLDVGEYRLTETKAPDGYVLLKNALTFTVTDNKTAEGDGIDGTPEVESEIAGIAVNAASDYIEFTIQNTKGIGLPVTGGMGTILFTAGGILLVGGAVALLFIVNRKKERRS